MPDGTPVAFPDDMPKEQIRSLIASKFPDFAKQFEPKTEPKTLTGSKNIDATLTRISQGVLDLPRGAGQLGLRAAETLAGLPGENVVSRAITKTRSGYEKGMREREAWYRERIKALTGEYPSSLDPQRLAANVLYPGNFVIPGGSTYGAALKGGAVSAAMQPVQTTEDTTGGDFYTQKGIQTAIGGVTSVGGTAVMRGVGNLVGGKVPDANIQTLLDENIMPTPGQIIGGQAAKLEESAQSIPFVGQAITGAKERGIIDFNRSVYNRALKPLGLNYGKELPVGREGVAAVHDAISKRYDEIVPGLTLKLDNKLFREFDILQRAVADDSNLRPEQVSNFIRIINNDILPKMKQGAATGSSVKNAQSVIREAMRINRASPDVRDNALVPYLATLDQHIIKGMARSNPKSAAELRKIDSAYAKYLRMEKASSSTQADGFFTPSAYNQAVKRMDTSKRKGAFARGQALEQDIADAAKTVLGDKLPNSGTADRAMLGALLAAGATGGLAYMSDPRYAALAAIPLAYTPAGQKMLAAAILQRPEFARAGGEMLRAAGNAVGPRIGAAAGYISGQ